MSPRSPGDGIQKSFDLTLAVTHSLKGEGTKSTNDFMSFIHFSEKLLSEM